MTVSLLEANDSVSVFNFDSVTVTTVSFFYFVDKLAFGIQEFKLEDFNNVCSHLDRFDGPVFRELKWLIDIECSHNLLWDCIVTQSEPNAFTGYICIPLHFLDSQLS